MAIHQLVINDTGAWLWWFKQPNADSCSRVHDPVDSRRHWVTPQFEAKEEKKDPAVCIQCDDLASSSSVSKYKMIARSSDHELNTLLCRKQCFTASLFFPDHSSGLVTKFSRVIGWRLSFLDCQRGSLRLTQMMSLDVKMLEETFHSVESNLWAPQGALLGLVQKTSTPHYIARQLSTLRLHPRPTFGSTGDRQVPRSTYFWAFKSVGEPKEHEMHFLPWALLRSSESPWISVTLNLLQKSSFSDSSLLALTCWRRLTSHATWTLKLFCKGMGSKSSLDSRSV